MALLPQSLRSRTPVRLRDDVRLRGAALALGLIPPRTMHSEADAAALREAAAGASRAVEIGVYEGASALALLEALPPSAELHLIDPFGSRPDALPAGWGAQERATRRVVRRAQRRRRAEAPAVHWHVDLSDRVAATWSEPLDLVFIDGDHSEAGAALDWNCWSPFVTPGGRVVFHDARLGRLGGRGLPGPSAVVSRLFFEGETPGWEPVAEADRTVVVRRFI
jgi:predicted O-methyltransferase YrrM